MWINKPQQEIKLGFLIRFSYEKSGREQYVLRDLPALTGGDQTALLYGNCGTFNDVTTHAEGVWEVERVAKNGRTLIRELHGDELDAALDELGFPDIEGE